MASNIKKNAIVAGATAAGALGAVALGAVVVVATGVVKQIAHTRTGRARVSEFSDAEGNRVRVLSQGGVYQSASYVGERCFEPVFAYYRSFDAMFEAEDAMRGGFGHGVSDVLMLGGGGFSFPKWALTRHPRLRMDVVEYDGAVIKLAKRWFYLGELERRAAGRLRVVQADARAFLDLTVVGSRRYDAIVNDCFNGSAPVRELATAESLATAKRCLTPGGLYLSNIVTAGEGTDVQFLRDCIATAAEVFAHVYVLDASDERYSNESNYLLVASDAPYFFEGSLGFGEEMYGEVLHDEKDEW